MGDSLRPTDQEQNENRSGDAKMDDLDEEAHHDRTSRHLLLIGR